MYDTFSYICNFSCWAVHTRNRPARPTTGIIFVIFIPEGGCFLRGVRAVLQTLDFFLPLSLSVSLSVSHSLYIFVLCCVMATATDDTAALPPSTDTMEEDATIAAPSFDLSKKKKKKKPKATASETPAASTGEVDQLANTLASQNLDDGSAQPSGASTEEQPLDFALPDFGAMKKKKKKKKKVFFDDDMADGEGDETAGDLNGPDRQPRRDAQPQPWDDTDRDYTYAELINRAFQFLHGKNPALAGGGTQKKRVTLQLPQVAREGTKKTVFMNFGAICKSIHRQQDHLLTYMSAELGTTGNIQDGGRLVIKGRFGAEGIANVLKRYMLEYVVCSSCRSPDTVLMRDANTRLYFVSCESCGAKRSVAPIKQGFMAQVERRKKK